MARGIVSRRPFAGLTHTSVSFSFELTTVQGRIFSKRSGKVSGKNAGGGEHVMRLPFGNDLAIREHDQLVAQGLNFGGVVRHQQHGYLELIHDTPQEGQNLAPQRQVERSQRLVEQKQPGP